MTQRWPTLVEDCAGKAPAVFVLDQTALPDSARMVRLDSLEKVVQAINTMQVRGAPLIGVTAAYGVALGLERDVSDEVIDEVIDTLAATRPTAVNLRWALTRMASVLRKSAPAERRTVAWREARLIAEEDIQANAAIGRHGAAALGLLSSPGKPLQFMTHCNAGRLATMDHGTALAPVYALHRSAVPLHVWVSETRPRNQGRLTAWELAEAAVPFTLIADNAAGLLMQQGQVDCVIVGADRIAANGDVANKIGTYLKALAARASGIPFYVAAPLSTVDFACPDGKAVPIEIRNGLELGAPDCPTHNPAFDITPANLITGIISEKGIVAPADLGSWKTT